MAKILIDDHKYIKVAFADKLKALAEDLFEVVGKDGEAREVYQSLGTNLRAIDQNVWLKPVANTIARYPNWKIVVDDVRYQNEFAFLRDNGFLMIKVEAPDWVRQDRITRLYPSTTTAQQNHISELTLHDAVGDGTIVSVDGTVIYDLEKYVNWGNLVGTTT